MANDTVGQGSQMRLALGAAAAVLLGIPLLSGWGWTLDRWSTNSAISSAVSQGDKAMAAGDPVRAMIAYNHARELRPSSPKLERNVWKARARFIADNADRVTVENLEESRYQVEQLLAEDSKNATYLVAQAHILSRRGDNAGADKYLADAVKTDAKSPVAHLARASFLQKTSNKIDEVMAEYNAVLAADPNNFAAHFGLGRMYLVKKDVDKEIESYKKAIAIDPKSYVAHEALGDALLHKGGDALKDAYKAYLDASTLAPNAPEPHWGMGIIESQAARWPEAEKQLRLAMKGRRFPEMEFQLGLAVARQGRCQEAMPLFLQFLREEPQHGPVLYELGSCAATLGQKENAMAFYKKVLDLPLPAEGDPRRADAQKRQELVKARIAALGAPAAPAAPAAAPKRGK